MPVDYLNMIYKSIFMNHTGEVILAPKKKHPPKQWCYTQSYKAIPLYTHEEIRRDMIFQQCSCAYAENGDPLKQGSFIIAQNAIVS